MLGELYGGAVETRIANDVEELLTWFKDDAAVPRTIGDANFQVDRLDSLSTRLSAAYKGINVLVLREGAQDFFWKSKIRDLDLDDVNLDIHHIFPKDWCEKQGIPAKRYDSIINKTPISYKANRMIGGSAPADYLAKLQAHEQVQLDDDAINSILASHLIDAEYLRSNDFDTFLLNRKQAFLALIERAMGKNAQMASLDVGAAIGQ